VVLSATAVAVAQNVDTSAAEAADQRDRATQAVADQEDGDCGCTAGVRAKDRMESRNTAEEAGER
jgi:uncharacterized low-complexity protein